MGALTGRRQVTSPAHWLASLAGMSPLATSAPPPLPAPPQLLSLLPFFVPTSLHFRFTLWGMGSMGS